MQQPIISFLPVNFDFEAFARFRRMHYFDYADTDMPDEMEDLAWTTTINFKYEGQKQSWSWAEYPQGARDAQVTTIKKRELNDYFDADYISLGQFVTDIIKGFDDNASDFKIVSTYPQAASWTKQTEPEDYDDQFEAKSFTVAIPELTVPKERKECLEQLEKRLKAFSKECDQFSSKIIELDPDVSDEDIRTGLVYKSVSGNLRSCYDLEG
jgi:hypothetical protein